MARTWDCKDKHLCSLTWPVCIYHPYKDRFDIDREIDYSDEACKQQLYTSCTIDHAPCNTRVLCSDKELCIVEVENVVSRLSHKQ